MEAPQSVATVADAVTPMVAKLEPDLIRLRRDLHRSPELAFDEHETGARVAETLTSLGLAVRRGVGRTGVLADLEGAAPGPRLLIRADMDALPITEATGREFASRRPGAMHACGHDAHTAAAIGAATALAELCDQLAGTVRFCFQPAEETLSGARAMIDDGALDGVDRVLGGHVFAPLPLGTVLNVAGPVLAGADFFELDVIGRAGHAGMLQSTIWCCSRWRVSRTEMRRGSCAPTSPGRWPPGWRWTTLVFMPPCSRCGGTGCAHRRGHSASSTPSARSWIRPGSWPRAIVAFWIPLFWTMQSRDRTL